jgi:phosphoserine phosphatase
VIGDLGFDHLLCTELEIGPDGLLTGRPKGPVCIDVHKRDMALKFAEEHRIDLQTSSAYGNHHSDIPLLELVGYPVVVEPTEPLMRMAVQRQWPVLSYR